MLSKIIFVILVTIIAFFIGAFGVKFLGLAKDQGLAGGAIVLFYALISSGVSLVCSIYLVNKLGVPKIIKSNWCLLIVLILLSIYLRLSYTSENHQHESSESKTIPMNN